MKGNIMKCIVLLICLIAFCVFAQNKGEEPPTTINLTLKSNVGQPIVGVATDERIELHANDKLPHSSSILLKQCVDVDRPYAFGINSINPNPFNPVCALEFEIEEEGEVSLQIFNIRGELVNAPIKDEKLQPGIYSLTWSGRNHPTGIFFARLSSGNRTVTKRMVLVK